jgi:DNA-binding MarR family transcriptional regulator
MSTGNPKLDGHDRPRNLAVALRGAFTALNDLVIPHLVQQGFDDLRPAHAAVFQYLDDTGTTVSVLAQRARMTKQAMAELVLHLEDHDYVARIPDPTDRRAKLVIPTERGLQVFRIAQALVPEIERRTASLIGEARLRQLRADLDAIQAEFEGASLD